MLGFKHFKMKKQKIKNKLSTNRNNKNQKHN